MSKVTDFSRLNHIAKRLIPLTSSLTSRRPCQNALSLVESLCAILQGKGSGTGWDMTSEAIAALPFLREGAVIFDVGANNGDWSLEVSRQSAYELKFFLFEPQQACQPELARLPLKHKVITKAAVGDWIGDAPLYSPGPGWGNASLYNRRDTEFVQLTFSVAEVVPVIPLDEFMQENHLDCIDYLKIDVEGHELAVLHGCRNALAAGMIKALAFEFGTGNLNSRTYFRDFWDLLTNYGYKLGRILPGGRCCYL